MKSLTALSSLILSTFKESTNTSEAVQQTPPWTRARHTLQQRNNDCQEASPFSSSQSDTGKSLWHSSGRPVPSLSQACSAGTDRQGAALDRGR